jgi:hypothetical protein
MKLLKSGGFNSLIAKFRNDVIALSGGKMSPSGTNHVA